MNAEGTALSHVRFVRIKCEDLLLCQPLFQQERNENFRYFTLQRTIGSAVYGKKKISCKLLRDGARSADALGIAHAVNDGARKAYGIDAPMGEEMLIFRSRQRIDKKLGKIVEFNQTALFARFVVKIRNQFRREPCLGVIPSVRLRNLR